MLFTVKESALILLQTVPTHLQLSDIKSKLLQVRKLCGLCYICTGLIELKHYFIR